MELTPDQSLPLEWDKRQPEELDFLKPHGFRFMVRKLPKVTYFCQSANIPALSLGTAVQTTPLIDLYRPGEKATFNDLTIRFSVQEDLANYREIFDWMIALSFPDNHKQYGDVFRRMQEKTDRLEYSDASLLILGNEHRPVAQVNFYNCYPTWLEGLEFDVSSGNVKHFIAQATFKYQVYDIQMLTDKT